ncbi:hypothetical protein PG985_004329 [Apiospora marii]|uniref:Apple domain-containing protein n=1 Tax=Apiospora marii TaxID=335849 RepID=A0ABR1S908_9PEZI
MAPRYDEAPETVPPAFPEYHSPPTAPEVTANHGYVQHQQPLPPTFKREDSTVYNQYPGYAMSPMGPPSTQNYDTTGYGSLPSDLGGRRREKRTILGCSVVVFVLGVIIAILSAAVIGLAAGTGVESNRANTAESNLAALRANLTSSTSPNFAAGNYDALTRGCSSNPTGASGTTYTSKFFDQSSYQIACNKETPNAPLQGLFVGNFDDCIDACASYTKHISENFANSTANGNKTCAGVTFVPGWTDRPTAEKGTAPGNCYLKPGPQGKAKLSAPNNGQETHSAFRLDD